LKPVSIHLLHSLQINIGKDHGSPQFPSISSKRGNRMLIPNSVMARQTPHILLGNKNNNQNDTIFGVHTLSHLALVFNTEFPYFTHYGQLDWIGPNNVQSEVKKRNISTSPSMSLLFPNCKHYMYKSRFHYCLAQFRSKTSVALMPIVSPNWTMASKIRTLHHYFAILCVI
jgi:hypothetical protein